MSNKTPEFKLTGRTKLSKILKEARIDKGWSQSELAYQTGYSESFISKVEKGGCRLTVLSFYQFARELGLLKMLINNS